jgi:hypothetical protein
MFYGVCANSFDVPRGFGIKFNKERIYSNYVSTEI